MADAKLTLDELRRQVATFVREREWEPFHNPKDLAAAIAIEAAELMELFLWKDPQEISEFVAEPASKLRVGEEVADILLLCLSLANRLQIDIADVTIGKLASNHVKYPAQLVRGKARKYTYYEEVPDAPDAPPR